MPDRIFERRELRTVEVQRILGISASTVRLWSNKGIIRPRITAGGHRRYDPDEIEQVRVAMAELFDDESD